MTPAVDRDDRDLEAIIRPRRDAQSMGGGFAFCVYRKASEINGDLSRVQTAAGPADGAIGAWIIRNTGQTGIWSVADENRDVRGIRAFAVIRSFVEKIDVRQIPSKLAA